MIRRRTPTLIAIMLFTTLSGQLYFSGSSSLRYGESKTGQLYSESILNGNLTLGNFSGWFQLEFSNPPELGRTVNGLQKFRLEYITDNSEFKFGDIYEIWGRGLVLNQYDDQAVDFNNSLTGVSFRNRVGDLLDWGLLAGKGDIWSSEIDIQNPFFNDRVPNYRRQHRVIGADMDWLVGPLNLGASYLQSRERHPYEYSNPDWSPGEEWTLTDTALVIHRVGGYRAEYLSDRFDIYLEYADKLTHDFNPDSVKSYLNGGGRGFYSNLNLYLGAWSVSLDYKKYGYNISEPHTYSAVNNYSGTIGYQRPPTVIREHPARLLGRITHQVDFEDEVGYQIELNGPIIPGNTILINYTRASRNEIWSQDKPADSLFWEWIGTDKTGFLPLKNSFAQPFNELFFEVEGFILYDRIHYRIGMANTSTVLDISTNQVTDSTRNIFYENQKAITVPLEIDYQMGERLGIELKYEYQRLSKKSRIINTAVSLDTSFSRFPAKYQYNAFLSLGVSHSPRWSVALLIDASSVLEYGVEQQIVNINTLENLLSNLIDLENRWVALELRWNITSSHSLTLTYGSQQGGILCSNGVCRQIEAFEDGFKIALTSLF